MSELWISHDDKTNMHVKQEVMHVNPADLPKELSEAELNAQKAGMRAILAQRLELIWQQCEPFILAGLGDGVDVRMMKIGLDVIDRQAKLHEVYQPDRPVGVDGNDAAVTASRREMALNALKALRARVGADDDEQSGDLDGLGVPAS